MPKNNYNLDMKNIHYIEGKGHIELGKIDFITDTYPIQYESGFSFEIYLSSSKTLTIITDPIEVGDKDLSDEEVRKLAKSKNKRIRQELISKWTENIVNPKLSNA